MLHSWFRFGLILATGLGTVPLQAQQVAYYKPGMSAGNQRVEGPRIPQDLWRTRSSDWRMADQPVRWFKVGRCVAKRDPDTSLILVMADPASRPFKAAYQQLDPIFDDCFHGSGAVSRGVASFRRAALADALHRRIAP